MGFQYQENHNDRLIVIKTYLNRIDSWTMYSNCEDRLSLNIKVQHYGCVDRYLGT
jgi:hypothetical protein